MYTSVGGRAGIEGGHVEPSGMMRTRVIVAFLPLLLGIVAPSGAAMAAQSSCGGSWSGPVPSGGCVIEFQGFPLTVSGRVTSTLGAGATVIAWIEIERNQVRIPILVCVAVRVGGTNCSQTAGQAGGPIRQLPLGARLRCRVAGLDYGIYSCASGTA